MTASRSVLRDYITLTKPRVISLLLVTALGGMFLATGGVPQLSLILVVLGGGILAAGGANALNHFMDRDLDELMTRTRNRPVVRGTISPRNAMIFGIALNIIAFVVLTAGANLLSALLTLSATLFYVFIYTGALKRTTPQNIVIGGAAGAIPPMVGWAAVTGYLGLPALYLFAIVFFWTPPHFWALALLLKDDYARAKVPMLPVVVGVDETKKYIFLYTWLVIGLTMMFFTTGVLGWMYFGVSTALGAGFIYYAWRLWRRPDIEGAKPLYLYSLAYLGLLFLVIMIESSVAF
ncbi:MAG: protoheme IX farnesyltransferase [Chloroflexi bacterium]|nr:protoheme IX farnesyltransferase [Chloroflexota bacterium]